MEMHGKVYESCMATNYGIGQWNQPSCEEILGNVLVHHFCHDIDI